MFSYIGPKRRQKHSVFSAVDLFSRVIFLMFCLATGGFFAGIFANLSLINVLYQFQHSLLQMGWIWSLQNSE